MPKLPKLFLVRRPLKKIWWSAKDKILIYIGIRRPLELISRTTSGPQSRLGESLDWPLGLNLPASLCAAFMSADPKSARKIVE